MKALLVLIALSTTCLWTSSEVSQNPPAKVAAYKILATKCNTCHQKKNPRKVFRLDNMEELAGKIYKQVFVKKRMPKGTKNKLSQAEYLLLQEWLFTQNIKP